MPEIRLEIDDYTARVLDVVKGKFGLKNRSEALNRFAIEKGSEYIERKPSEMVLREIDAEYSSHIKKHGLRSMSKEKLDEILGLKDV
jgi:hypothetical protein